MQKQYHLANFLPISRVKAYPQDKPIKNLMTVAVSNFQVPTRWNVWKTENICSWKKIVTVLRKKQTKCLHWFDHRVSASS